MSFVEFSIFFSSCQNHCIVSNVAFITFSFVEGRVHKLCKLTLFSVYDCWNRKSRLLTNWEYIQFLFGILISRTVAFVYPFIALSTFFSAVWNLNYCNSLTVVAYLFYWHCILFSIGLYLSHIRENVRRVTCVGDSLKSYITWIGVKKVKGKKKEKGNESNIGDLLSAVIVRC